jgi:DNA-binding NarL/FixJ family response regulator
MVTDRTAREVGRVRSTDQEHPMGRVLVVEDQRALADTLRLAINAQPDMGCVGAVRTVEQAMPILLSADPDVVLMDIHLPDVDGIEGTRRIKEARPGVRVLVLTADPAPELLAGAADAGASGFLAKDSSFRDILAAIRNPLDGKFLVEGAALSALLEQLPSGRPARPPRVGNRLGLTGRELEVIDLMGQGLDPRAIAGRLMVSEHTARGHVKNVMTKLGAHSQLEAVVVATQRGLLAGRPTTGLVGVRFNPFGLFGRQIWGVERVRCLA